MLNLRNVASLLAASALFTACAVPEPTAPIAADAPDAPEASEAREVPKAPETATPQITFGDGERNWIVMDGLSRTDATLHFKEVQIDGNGWLVLHPFKDGRPVGEIYAAASYISDGRNEDVAITLEDAPKPGTPFLVMLHSDVNENREFDFVFVDEHHVLDRAVFEGSKMVSHTFQTPIDADASNQALAWLDMIDKDAYAASWDHTTAHFQSQVDRASWTQAAGDARSPLGALERREQISASYHNTLPNAPDGEYVVFQYRTDFRGKSDAVETLTVKLEDGDWLTAGYFIR